MNKEKFYELLRPLIEIYDSIEIEMILDILDRIDNYSDNRGTLKWYLDKLNELKLFERNNISIVNKNNKEIKKILEEIIEKATKGSINLDSLGKYNEHYSKDLSVNDIFNSLSANNIINEALKNTESICKLINTKAIESANKEYQNILNAAYLETSTGIYTYDQSIKRAINKMADNGILMTNYDSGRRISIEAAVRRDIVTRVNKLVGDIEIETAKKLDTNLVYVDQHLGARTRTEYMEHDYEAHDEWQGKVYMIDGSNNKYDNFYEKTGYGEMLGLKGINCYHDFRPYFEWEKILEPIDIEESRKQREIFDKQREYERKIRVLKRERMIAEHQGYDELLSKNKKRTKDVNKEYKEFLEENNLTRRYNNEHTANQPSNEKISSIYNNSKNREQYERYKNILLEDAPDTFDKFLEIKYNNANEWNTLKADYSDARGIYSEAQANMYINLVKDKFREGQQGKHILEHSNYIEGNSYVTISNEHIQELVDRYATTGEKKFNVKTEKWLKTEKIVTNEIIGVYINKNYETMNMTNSFTIRYSKKGYHIVPANYTERSDKDV